MTNTRKSQIRTLAILLLAVVGLTMGFAAFTSSLRIKTRLSVNPNKGTFNVKFSKVANTLNEDNVIPTKSSDIFEAFEGEIDNSGIPTISELGGEFTQPGESITYEFYAINMGEYKAYLTDVIFGNVDGEDSNKVCTSLDGTHQSDVDVACDNISIKVTVGSDILTTSRSNLVGHNLNPNGSEKIVVEIKYASGGILPEVPFSVEFGDISMIYNSLEASDLPAPTEYSYTIPTPDYYYFAVSDGNGGAVIVNYNPNASDAGNYTEGVIPSTLPISTITISYNENKCIAYMDNYIETHGTLAGSGSGSSGGEEMTAEEYCGYVSQEDVSEIDPYEMPIAMVLDAEPGSEAEFMIAAYDVQFTEPSGSYPVTGIGIMSFASKNLTSINIPSSVEIIGEAAFAYNSLTSVSIPSGVENIGSYAFAANDISSLTLSNGVKYIEDSAFLANKLTSVEIPNSVTSIEEVAFAYNNLTSVTIGSGISSIGDGAFGTGTTDIDEKPSSSPYGSNALTSVTIGVPSSYESSFTSQSQFGWADGYSNSNIVWSD